MELAELECLIDLRSKFLVEAMKEQVRARTAYELKKLEGQPKLLANQQVTEKIKWALREGGGKLPH